jgi:fatty-acyl-CoA synthase
VDWVGRESITNTFMIPNMLRKMMDLGVFQDPVFQKNLKAVHTGAGLMRMPDKELFAQMLPDADLYFRYGLTEAGPMVTRLRSEDMLDPAVDGSIGQEYFLVESQLQDLDGNAVAAGELGEICVRGPSLMTGYYGQPEQTAEAMRGGWLHTGDLATQDERGYYYFRDRLKEMIKTGGENVYAAEVEQALHLHPAVLEAAVLGVPDLKWDEEVRAAVVLRSGAQVTQTDLAAFLRTKLAGYKVPKQMVFLGQDAFPRSAAGKLVKSQLKHNLGWGA